MENEQADSLARRAGARFACARRAAGPTCRPERDPERGRSAQDRRGERQDHPAPRPASQPRHAADDHGVPGAAAGAAGRGEGRRQGEIPRRGRQRRARRDEDSGPAMTMGGVANFPSGGTAPRKRCTRFKPSAGKSAAGWGRLFSLTQESTMKQVSMLALSVCMTLGIAAPVAAQTQFREQAESQVQKQEQERIYGSELMTPRERAEYQARMRAAKTEQERNNLRLQHHKEMQERARAQGKTLPDMPPADRGPGMGPGGGGMGPGGGGMMGPGGRGGY